MEQDKFIYNGLEHGLGNCILSNVHSRIVANYFDKKLYIAVILKNLIVFGVK